MKTAMRIDDTYEDMDVREINRAILDGKHVYTPQWEQGQEEAPTRIQKARTFDGNMEGLAFPSGKWIEI